MTRVDASHAWSRGGGVIQCARCGARPHWPLAEDACSGPLVSKGERARMVPMTLDEVKNEVGAALDKQTDSGVYSVCGMGSSYGRDGRRKDGK